MGIFRTFNDVRKNSVKIEGPSAATRSETLSRRQIARSTRLSIFAGCLGMLWMSLSVGLPLTMFMEALGASGVLIGLITAVRLASMAAQIPGAMLAEAMGSRKRVWAALALSHRALWFVPAALALIAHTGEPWIPVMVVAAVTLSEMLGNASAAPWLSWMTDLIPGRTSGKFWGTRQSVVTAVSLGGLWLAGYLLDSCDGKKPSASLAGFAIVFALAAVFGLLDIIVHLGVPEPTRAVVQEGTPAWRRLLAPLHSVAFRRLTLAIGVWSFGFAMVGTFGIVYLKKEFALSYSELAVLTVAGSLGSVASSYFLGSLIDRVGSRISACLLFLTAPLSMLGYFFIGEGIHEFAGLRVSDVTLIIFLTSICGGALFSGVGLCQIRLLGVLSEASGRTMWMAVHACLIGFLAALGPLTGGFVMDWFAAHPTGWELSGGIEFSFYHAQILLFFLLAWGVALPVLLSVRMPEGEMPFNAAVSEMLLTSPVQVVRNFYNISLMTTGSTRRERAGAARKLGGTRTRLAVPDLVAKLEDPSLDLQEEAVEALGSIGSPEAVDALLAQLRDPSALVAPKICRALRQAADPRAVDALIGELSSPEREVVIESVRALGSIGERRAIPCLLDLMKETRDRKLLAVSSEALALLGELSAAYQIIPQIRETESRTLKQALSLALGDLLGEPEVFYQLLILDRESSGAGAAKELGRLGRRVKKHFPRAVRQIESLDELEAAYEAGDLERCSSLLLHLGLHLIQFMHRLQLTLDPNQAMLNLMECDRQAGITVWYLKILDEPWMIQGRDARDSADILLGIHILTSRMAARSTAS